MKDYSVTVELSFSVEATTEEKAQERAQEAVDSITFGCKAKWFGDVDIGEPNVEEA